MLMNRTAKKIGDCEICTDKLQVEVWVTQGNILMCAECKADLDSKVKSVDNIIEKSRVIDSSIQIKPDIYNAKTIPTIELRASIEQNEAISPTDKEYAYADETFARYMHFKQVVFEGRQKLNEQENEMRVWQMECQTSAGKLRADQREKFKAIDITYEPVTVTKAKIKSATKGKTPTTSAKQQVADAREAAKKYGVDAVGVQMMAQARNMSADDAAQELAKMLVKK